MSKETTKIITAVLEGSLWKAPNRIWKNRFAKKNSPKGLHPAIVEEVSEDKISAVIIPGTSKKADFEDCAFKIKLSKRSRKESNFLLEMSMTYKIKFIKEMTPGWDNMDKLSEDQLDMLGYQRHRCNDFLN